MKKYFESYLQFREDNYIKPGDGGIISKIKLTKKEGSKEFAPLVISRNERPNLRTLVQAFINSPHVGLGYTTLDKSKGEIEPQLKKKSIYLTGGAVRDHLKGKTPNGYDLVTDATASEIRLILTQPEFKFIEIQPDNPEYKNHKDWSKYMKKLIENPTWVEDLGEQLFETVNSRYHMRVLSENRKDFYNSL